MRGGGARPAPSPPLTGLPIPWRTAAVASRWRRLLPPGSTLVSQGISIPCAAWVPGSQAAEYQGPLADQLACAIAKLRAEGILLPCSDPEPVLNYVFPVPKSQGKVRVVISARTPNLWARPRHIRLPTIRQIAAMLPRGVWMCRIDISQAYFHLRLRRQAMRLFAFRHRGETLAFQGLPMGWSESAFFLEELLRPVEQSLRRQGISLIRYMDDWLLWSNSQAQAAFHCRRAVETLESLGILVNRAKSAMTPSTVCDFLGFALNSTTEIVALSSERRHAIIRDARHLLQASAVSNRFLARLTGRLTSCCQIAPIAQACRHGLARNVLAAAKGFSEWDDPVLISEESRSCARRLIEAPRHLFSSPFRAPRWWGTLTTDASGSGWGAFLDLEGRLTTASGFWHESDRLTSSNQRETYAISRAFLALVAPSIPSGAHLRIRTDNMSARAYAAHLGGRQRHLQQLASPLVEAVLERSLMLSAVHLPGEQNSLADALSRRTSTPSDVSLLQRWFMSLTADWGEPQVDLFASHASHRLPLYVSRWPDPNALAADALEISWERWVFLFLFPPPLLLPQVWERILHCRARMLLIIPRWQAKWWPAVSPFALQSRDLPAKAFHFPAHGRWDPVPARAFLLPSSPSLPRSALS